MSRFSQLLAPDAQFERGRARRRAVPIICYVGRNGSGKSLTSIADTLPTLDQGRPVLSTVRLLDYDNPSPCDGWVHGPANVYGHDPVPCRKVHPHTGEHLEDGHTQSHPLYLPFTDWDQFMRFEAGDILMDEITGVADSSDHAGMPVQVRNKFPQLRRADVAIRITGLSWSRLNKRLREACLGVVRCRGAFPVPANSEFGKDRIFRPKRMTIAGLYSTDDLPTDDISKNAFEDAECLNRSRLWIPTSVAARAYDTFDAVDMVGHADMSGPCMVCGGTRPRPKCSCPSHSPESDAPTTGAGGAGSEADADPAQGVGSPLGLVAGDGILCRSETHNTSCGCHTPTDTVPFSAVNEYV